MRRIALLALAVLVLTATGCSSPDTERPPGRRVSSADITPWPFSVQSGTLNCARNEVTFQPDGGPAYAVNGTAKSSGRYRDLAPEDPLWLDDTTTGVTVDPPLKVSVGETIDAGLKLCD